MQRFPSIALVGRQGAGKDSVGEILAGDYGYQARGFADVLREAVAMVYGLDLPRLKYDPEYKNQPHPNLNGKTPRFALQHVGTEGFRAVYEDTWPQALELSVDWSVPLVVTDLRFLNEASWARKKGLILVAVLRSEAEENELLIEDTHSSEAAVPLLVKEAIAVGNVIRNYGSLTELKSKVTYFLEGRASTVK